MVPKNVAGGIFINYRRGDDAGNTGRLFDRLRGAFRPEQLFMDVDDIPPGIDFVRELEDQVAKCDVLLAVIGKAWIDARDAVGARRLDNPKDFVRIEIESALKQGKRVIPVLVGGASMPSADQLPDPIQPLATRNAVRLTLERFHADVDGLVKALRRALGEPDVPGPARRDVNQTESERPRSSRYGSNQKTVFVSYPKDIPPRLMKRIAFELIRHGFRIWLYDPVPFGFSDDDLKNISHQRPGVSFASSHLRQHGPPTPSYS